MKKFIKIGGLIIAIALIIANVKIALSTAPACTVNGSTWPTSHQIKEDGHCVCTDYKSYTLYWCDTGSTSCTESHATPNCN